MFRGSTGNNRQIMAIIEVDDLTLTGAAAYVSMLAATFLSGW